MQIFETTKRLAKLEQHYTAKLLKNLATIQKDKLYADLRYPSLRKYIIKELGYTDAEATLRVNAVRLMLKSDVAVKKVEAGELSLSNAAEAGKALNQIVKPDKSDVEEIVIAASESSTREFNNFVAKKFKKKRQEVLVLDEYMLDQFDRLRKEYGDLSTYELVQILLQEKLRAPIAKRSGRTPKRRNSRSIPKAVKVKVYTGECRNCGVRHGLEYDHKLKHSHGGHNGVENIQMLCRSCNQRKEIRTRQAGFFT